MNDHVSKFLLKAFIRTRVMSVFSWAGMMLPGDETSLISDKDSTLGMSGSYILRSLELLHFNIEGGRTLKTLQIRVHQNLEL
jgi:hypothetical protein